MPSIIHGTIYRTVVSAPAIKWSQTDKDRLAAVNVAKLYRFVVYSQQGRPVHQISIAEKFPFENVCVVYIPKSLKCSACLYGHTQEEPILLCQLGSIRASVGESAIRIINKEVFLTRQEYYEPIKSTLDLFGLDYINVILV